MSSNDFTLKASSREDLGKGASRRLRRLEELMPAIVYGSNKKPKNISIVHKDMQKALENEAFYSHILQLEIDGKNEKVILKDLQRHPYKKIIMHADFLRVSDKTAINVHVPIHFTNEDTSVGLKAGGLLSKHLVEIEIKCLPKALPEHIDVDLSTLEIGQVIHTSDLSLPKDVSFVSTEDLAVVSIHKAKMPDEEDTGEDIPSEEAKPEDKDN